MSSYLAQGHTSYHAHMHRMQHDCTQAAQTAALLMASLHGWKAPSIVLGIAAAAGVKMLRAVNKM